MATLESDCCVIGAGPAGLAVAAALAATGSNVVVLESGGKPGNGAPHELDAARDESAPSIGDPREIRARAIGGTSSIWNTLRGGVVGAKIVALDHTERAEWPIDATELDHWYRLALEHVGLDLHHDAATWATRDPGGQPAIAWPRASLENSWYRWASAEAVTARPAARAVTAGARIVADATVTGFATDHDGTTVTAVHHASSDGTHDRVRCREVVVAAGTIENTRLLWQLPAVTSSWLGRGLMEHPIDRDITFTTRHAALSPGAGCYAHERHVQGQQLIGRITLSEAMRREQGLVSASLRLFPARQGRRATIQRAVRARLGSRPVTRYRTMLDLEQRPDPQSAIVRTTDRDRFGMPIAAIRWRWSAEDESRRTLVRQAVARELQAIGHDTTVVQEPRPLDPATHHVAGTTRMASDPDDGVVSAALRVHQLANVHVVGASVFPTAGVANPTLTLIALALRLGASLGPKR